jgi:hypothetical protein
VTHYVLTAPVILVRAFLSRPTLHRSEARRLVSRLNSRGIPMTTSSRATLVFFSILALQLILGVMVTIGLFHSGFWRTAVLETCKLAACSGCRRFGVRRENYRSLVVYGNQNYWSE